MATWHPNDLGNLDYDALAASLAQLSVTQKSSIQAANKPRSSGGIKKGGMHLLGSILKVLDAPRNAIFTGAIESGHYLDKHPIGHGYNPGSDIGAFIHGAKRGVTRQDTTSAHELFKSMEGHGVGNLPVPTKGVAGAVAGFAGDVAGDPLSYLGIGVIDKAGKLAKAGHRVEKVVPEAHAREAVASPEMPPELVDALAGVHAQAKNIKTPVIPPELMKPSSAVDEATKLLAETKPQTPINVVDSILKQLPDTATPVAKATKAAKLPPHPGKFVEPDFVDPAYTGKWFNKFSTKHNAENLSLQGHLELAKRFRDANKGSLAAKEQEFADIIDSKLGLQTSGKDAAQNTSGFITNAISKQKVSLSGRGWMDATAEERRKLIQHAFSVDENGVKTGLKFTYHGEKVTLPELWTKVVGVPIEAAYKGGLPGAKFNRDALLKSMHYAETKGYRETVDKHMNDFYDNHVPAAAKAHAESIKAWEKMAADAKKTPATAVTNTPVAEGALDFRVKKVNANRLPMVQNVVDSKINAIHTFNKSKNTLTEIDQQNMLNSIWTGLRKENKVWSAKRDYSVMNSMLKEAEHVARDAGFSSTLRDGTPFSLADFLEAAAPTPVEWDQLSKNITVTLPKLFERYPKAYASAAGKTALDEATKVKDVVTSTVASAGKAIVDGAPVAETTAHAVEQAKNIAQGAGVSEATVKSVGEHVKQAIPEPVVPPKVSQVIAEASHEAVKTPKAVDAASERVASINKKIGIYYLGQPTRLYIPGSGPLANGLAKVAGNVPETFSRMFNNSYGDELLHDDNRMAMSKALNYAGERVTAYHAMFDGVSEEEARIAWDAARSGDTENALGVQINKRLESLFGNRLETLGSSVVKRSGLSKNEVNDFLKKDIKIHDISFTDTIRHPVKGTIKAEKWSDTWHNWKIPPKDIPDILHRVELAVEKATARAQFVDHVGYSFGVKTKDAPSSFVSVHDAYGRLRGLKFAPEVGPQLEKSLKEWVRSRDLGLQSPVVRLYDQVLSKWKTGVTIYNPSHHVRNAIGDIFIAHLAGVNTYKPYKMAYKVMAKNHHRYTDADIGLFAGAGYDLKLFQNGDALKRAIANPRTDAIFKWRGKDVTHEQVYAGFNDMGLRQNVAATEQLGEVTNTGGALAKVGYKVRQGSEYREDVIRMGHFIHATQKSKAATLEDAMREAAKTVRKHHFDYGDLTEFEQKYMKRIVPFYTWMRKSTPLMMRYAFTDPGKAILAYPKMQFSIADAAGMDPQSIDKPYSDQMDSMLPDWLKGTGFAPFAMHGANLLTENIGNPMNDSIQQWSGGLGSQLANITPVAKVPIELATKTNLFTGAHIKDKTQYIDQQIPGVNQIGGMTNTSPLAGTLESMLNTVKGGNKSEWKNKKFDTAVGGPANLQKIMNYLLGTGQEIVPK